MAELLVMTKNSGGTGTGQYKRGDVVSVQENGFAWGGEEIVKPMIAYSDRAKYSAARRVTPSVSNGLVYKLAGGRGAAAAEPVWGTVVGGTTKTYPIRNGVPTTDPKHINVWKCLGPDVGVYRTMAVLKIPDATVAKAIRLTDPEHILQDPTAGFVQRRLWGFLIANVPQAWKAAIASDGFVSKTIAEIKPHIRNKNTDEGADL